MICRMTRVFEAAEGLVLVWQLPTESVSSGPVSCRGAAMLTKEPELLFLILYLIRLYNNPLLPALELEQNLAHI